MQFTGWERVWYTVRKRGIAYMAKGKQKLKPDIVLKNYWSNEEQFADLFNAVLFQGEDIIKPEELEAVDSEESTVFEEKEYAETLKLSRDVIKVQKVSTSRQVQLVLLGIENQEHIHYAMPMRVMGYDYGSYKKQYDDNAKKYQSSKGLEEDEYLSRMKKTDRLIPVITVVIYYGEKPWDGACSLHDMLNIPAGMEQYVSNYTMILVEARKNDLILHNVNNKDLFNLLEYILNRTVSKQETKRKVIQYAEEHDTDKIVLMAVSGATNVKLDYSMMTKGGIGMCSFFDEIKDEGKMEAKFEIISSMLDNGMQMEKISEIVKMSIEEIEYLLKEYGEA